MAEIINVDGAAEMPHAQRQFAVPAASARLEVRRMVLGPVPAELQLEVCSLCLELLCEKKNIPLPACDENVNSKIMALAKTSANKEELEEVAGEVQAAFELPHSKNGSDMNNANTNNSDNIHETHARTLRYVLNPTYESPRMLMDNFEVPKACSTKEQVLLPYLWVDMLVTQDVEQVVTKLQTKIALFFVEATKADLWSLMRERAEALYEAFLRTAADFVQAQLVIPLHLWRLGFAAAEDLMLVKANMGASTLGPAKILSKVLTQWRSRKLDYPSLMEVQLKAQQESEVKEDKKKPAVAATVTAPMQPAPWVQQQVPTYQAQPQAHWRGGYRGARGGRGRGRGQSFRGGRW